MQHALAAARTNLFFLYIDPPKHDNSPLNYHRFVPNDVNIVIVPRWLITSPHRFTTKKKENKANEILQHTCSFFLCFSFHISNKTDWSISVNKIIILHIIVSKNKITTYFVVIVWSGKPNFMILVVTSHPKTHDKHALTKFSFTITH